MISAIKYAPPPAKYHHDTYKAFGVNSFELFTNCKIVANCYNDTQKEYRYYSHDDLVTGFPFFDGFINTALSLRMGEGFEAEGEDVETKQKNEAKLNKLLNSQTRKGTLQSEEITSWVREYIVRKTSILFVDPDSGFEHLDKCKAEEVSLSIDDSVSWNTDVAGIIYFTEKVVKDIPKTIKIDYATQGIIQKIIEYDGAWYIPKENLVVLGKYSDLCYDLSIFDSDRTRVQYVVEAYRLAVDELSRDKIPPVILEMKALAPRDRALALGVNPALADTPEGVENFQKEIIAKYIASKTAVAKNLLTDPQQGKIGFLDKAIYDGLVPLPTNGSYQDDLSRAEEMAKSVMSNLLNIPTAVLGDKSDSNWGTIKTLLQFVQNTTIKKEQDYLNIKLAEISSKYKLGFNFVIDATDFVDEEVEANIEKTNIDSARQLVGFGVPLEDVANWISERVEIDIDFTKGERFTDSSLVPYVDSSLLVDSVPPIDSLPAEQSVKKRKSGIEKTIV